MDIKYQLEYIETEETLVNLFKLYFLNKNSYMYKLIVGIAGPVVFGLMMFYGNPVSGGGLFLFILKFLSMWLAAFVVGDILSKTVGKKTNISSAERSGQEQYARRLEKRGEQLTVHIDFYDDRFTSISRGKNYDYLYSEITRLIESDEVYGVVVGTKMGKKTLVGFPKNGLIDTEPADFAKFIEEKCTMVKKGFKKI